MIHVLVVEDDPMNAVLFRKLLEKRCGYRVTVTESADEVIERARSGDIGLILMDVSLANTHYQGGPVNGVELCRLLKQDAAARVVPVVLATAHAMRGDAEELLAESGADDYVSKPVMDHVAFCEQIARRARKEAA